MICVFIFIGGRSVSACLTSPDMDLPGVQVTTLPEDETTEEVQGMSMRNLTIQATGIVELRIIINVIFA